MGHRDILGIKSSVLLLVLLVYMEEVPSSDKGALWCQSGIGHQQCF